LILIWAIEVDPVSASYAAFGNDVKGGYMSQKQIIMKMDKNHPLEVHASCKTCGGQPDGAGYLCGSDEEGNGVVLWIEEQEVFDIVAKIIAQQS
jgi:hypothetical protein